MNLTNQTDLENIYSKTFRHCALNYPSKFFNTKFFRPCGISRSPTSLSLFSSTADPHHRSTPNSPWLEPSCPTPGTP